MIALPVPPIIGLVGRKRAGKDTVAAHLAERYGYRRLAFADPMRAALLALDPYVETIRGALPVRLSDVVRTMGWEAAKEYPDVRRLLQRFGTEMGRAHFGNEFWVDLAWRRVRGVGPWVITDVRFPNEADRVRCSGGVLLRVVRPGLPEGDLHASETALDEYRTSAVISNDSTVADLAAGVDSWLKYR